MKKLLMSILVLILAIACNNGKETALATQQVPTIKKAELMSYKSPQNIHSYTSETLEGDVFDFSSLKGKRILIVNTASECGFTPQYEQLQELFEEYGGERFTIVGFPSNDFGRQEPGSNEEIKSFCQKNYGVSFPMMAKTPVKGKDQHPVYDWLTHKAKNGKEDATVQWNFNKFLVNENGEWVAHYPSNVSPLDEKIIAFAEGK